MLPASSSDAKTRIKPPKIPNSVQNHISSHPCLWLSIAFLLIQGLVISFVRNSPLCFPAAAHVRIQEAVTSDGTEDEPTSLAKPEECPLGKVYVYDLPSMFNEELLLYDCPDLDTWNWQCGIATNRGFGGPANELRPILPENLVKSWYRTNEVSLELMFHRRILMYRCRTLEPESASAFYIPFYAGISVGKYLWIDDTSKRDWHGKMMLEWVTAQEYWKKSNGSDHFIAIGRHTWDFRRLTDAEQKWGSSLLNEPEMQKVTRLIIEKAPDDNNDVTVPYPIGFHPKTGGDLKEWQEFLRNYNRSKLFSFIGDARSSATNDFRGQLPSYCRNKSDYCWLVDCSVAPCTTNSLVKLEALLGSEFCLQPRRDGYTRRSIFECMVAGSVPVFFLRRTADDYYKSFLPGEPDDYSVCIDHTIEKKGVSTIEKVLKKFSKEEIRSKREVVIQTIPRIIYGNGGFKDFKDAFDIAVDGVLERIKRDKELAEFL